MYYCRVERSSLWSLCRALREENSIYNMSDYIKHAIEVWKKLGQSVYFGDRLKNNLRLEIWVGVIITIIGSIMTSINIVQNKGAVTYTTAAFACAGIAVVFFAGVLKKRTPAIITMLLMCVIFFTWYAISGVNEGFAILWIMLVPLAFSYFGDVRYGVSLSVYYQLLLFILFYSPVRVYMAEYYTETFMNRFPILHLCGVALNSIAMIQYHLSYINQIEYEKKLKEAVDRAVKADNSKSIFLAQMSHEIRTPINTVLGMNEMILRTSKEEETLDYAENIDLAGNTLLSLINSILDFSKIEDGKMEIHPVNYDTTKFINSIINSISQSAKSKGLEFLWEIDGSIPKAVFGDDVRLSQVIINLLTNAVKYTEEGSVKLIIRCDSLKDDDLRLFVAVADTGIGIKEEDLDRLDVSFERLDEIRNHNIEGTGLGISIVTRLLEMMGSSLMVESTYGKGSVFSFYVEQKIIDAAPLGDFDNCVKESRLNRASDHIIAAPSARVLVVDDNEMNLKVAKNLLKLCQIVPDTATSGMDAIDMIRQNKYDVVFLDHMMPKMDGVETLNRLKSEELISEETSVVALTANAILGARETYINAGFNDYLSKPIEMDALVEKLKQYLPEKAYTLESSDEKTDEGIEVLEFAPAGNEDDESDNTSNQITLRRLETAGLDTDSGLKYSGGDEMFFIEVVKDFVDSAGTRLLELKTALESNDMKSYQINAHTIKSASKTIGAKELSEMAFKMEEASRDNDRVYISKNHNLFINTFEDIIEQIKDAMGLS